MLEKELHTYKSSLEELKKSSEIEVERQRMYEEKRL